MARIKVTTRTEPRPTASAEATLDRVMADWANELTAAINDPWPENTGRSRWFVEKVATGAYSVCSPARYAPHVHLKGDRTPFVEKHAPAIVAEVGAETANELARAMAPHVLIGVTDG